MEQQQIPVNPVESSHQQSPVTSYETQHLLGPLLCPCRRQQKGWSLALPLPLSRHSLGAQGISPSSHSKGSQWHGDREVATGNLSTTGCECVFGAC